jgi:hypothetical protein
MRPKGVILLTDGEADFEECYVPGLPDGVDSPVRIDVNGDGSNNDCNAFKFDNYTYKYSWWYYKTSPLMAEKLLAETDFPTYVIGFNAGPKSDALLRQVAYAGQTCGDMNDADCYYMASDRQQLQFAFHDVVTRLKAQGPDFRSRARPITSTRTSFRDSNTGYYEVSADFITTTRRPRGRIERVTYMCNSAGQFEQARVEDFADALARMSPQGRSIFTARSTLPTNGGVLHALLMADINNDAPIEEGQELWAYVPHTIHPKLATLPTQRQLTVDGTPLIRDVRLYSDTSRQPAEQWATVLIGTLRGGGRGVFALDISDPYHPKFLWEINNEDPGFVLLGDTYAEATIGSVALSNGESAYEAAVVILPGGVPSSAVPGEGEVLYVIELATGRLLRTFTTLSDGSPLSQMTGAATPSSAFPGTLMTRAFVGDSWGRLLRIGFASPEPEDWTLDLFFDPTPNLPAGKPPERIMQPPAVAKDKDNNLVVIYGSGDHSSLSPAAENANFVASVTEEIAVIGDQITVRARTNWFFTDPVTPFKISSPVLIFDSTAYFATLARSTNACINYGARLYGFHFTEADATGKPKVRVDLNGSAQGDFAEFAAGTSIFGMDLTVRPTCVPSLDPSGAGGGPVTAAAALQQSAPPSPQLVVQTGVQAYASGAAPSGTTDTPVTANERVSKARIDIPRPSQTAFPLFWSAVYE